MTVVDACGLVFGLICGLGVACAGFWCWVLRLLLVTCCWGLIVGFSLPMCFGWLTVSWLRWDCGWLVIWLAMTLVLFGYLYVWCMFAWLTSVGKC